MHGFWFDSRCIGSVRTLERDEMMDVYDLVTFTSQYVLAGIVLESICIFIGYGIFTVFELLQGGK